MQRLRHHRKGLPLRNIRWAELSLLRLGRSLWQPGQINWWIGTVFALGSTLFALGGLLTLCPEMALRLSLNETGINRVFFAGSIPFSTAAYLQLFQAANSFTIDLPGKKPVWFGWKPSDKGWLSCALQFAGTLLFNLNTWDAMQPDLNWVRQDLAVWVPDLAGSVLFLISCYLAFVEYCRALWGWHPKNISWWITFVNLAGCAAFMIAAILAFVPSGAPESVLVTWSVLFTTAGAIGFLAGSLLMLPEAAR